VGLGASVDSPGPCRKSNSGPSVVQFAGHSALIIAVWRRSDSVWIGFIWLNVDRNVNAVMKVREESADSSAPDHQVLKQSVPRNW
jgi:hypothetical protein